MEDALQKSNNHFREMFEQTADALLLLDPEVNKFVDYNQAAAKMLGYVNKEDLSNLHPAELSPTYQPDGLLSADKAEAMISIAMHYGSHRFDWVHRSKYREDFSVEVLLTPVHLGHRQLILTTWRDISERKKNENALKLTQFVVDHSSVEAYRINSEGRILYANQTACKEMGYSEAEMLSLSISDIDPIVRDESWIAHWQDLVKQKAIFLETMHKRKNGTTRSVEVSANYVNFDGKEYNFAFVRDISERKQAQERVIRLTHLYKALSEINQAIVRMEEQTELFPLVCRCAVEFGGMKMAWVGQLDEVSSMILPVARYGDHLNYLNGIAVSASKDVPEGNGPMGKAMRTNRPIVINDFFNSPMTLPWRTDASDNGWKSVAAFPISRGRQPFAVLAVYDSESDAFDDETISLFVEMSVDIAFALDNFDREVERKANVESLQLAASVYATSSEAMMVVNAENKILAINPAFTEITGYCLKDVLGKSPSILKSGMHDDAFYESMWHDINTTGKWQGEVWDRRKNGEAYPKWLVINTIFDKDRSVIRRIALFNDISHKKESDELIWQHANLDYLTELPNRRMFQDRLEQEIKKAQRSKLSFKLLFLDIDNFKEVNDTLGHAKGDVLLKEAAKRLTNCVRESDTVARFGGDEFTVLLSEIDDTDHVDRVIQKILQVLSEPFHLGNEIAYVSASIGVTCYPNDGKKLVTLLKNADQAMYAAKVAGRNGFSYYTPAMQATAKARMALANDLRSALSENQLWVAYQPIIELSTKKITKAEALIRWQHPKLGLINPADFIPIAEHTGLINDIGEFVFHQAIQKIKRWQEIHGDEFQISINVSPIQINDKSGKYEPWHQQLKKLGLAGRSIVVEITEGLLLEGNASIIKKLLEYRDEGTQVALDDFGTGYSSLSYLKKFDIDYIKIDQSFVRNLAPESEDMALCEAIIVMAHKLGLKVIAEGVETVEHSTLLIGIGCDYAQGYLFSRPLPASEFEKLL
jgi:diguanylate cyclase (GGDEF)-like protein/PAS domain S-box-containing protein